MPAMDHAEEPTADINAPQNEDIVAAESVDDHLPSGNSTRDMDTMIDDGGDDFDDMVGQPNVAASAADAGSEDDNGSNVDNRLSEADSSSAVAVDQAEQADMSTIALRPVPMDVDGGSEPDEQKAPSGEMEGSATPAGGSQSADMSADDYDGQDDDSQPVARAGSEASLEMESNPSADDGTASLNEDYDKMDSSLFAGSDAGKSEETASMEDDADRDEIISSERTALEDAYGPYIHPTDMCLDDARKRLRIAIEQTRILRESFNDQAYERFRVVMRPAPTSIDEIVDPIEEDPTAAVATLRENSQARQVEKEKEMRQSQQTGIPSEELSYVADGLDLVVLPDDEETDNEVDLEQYPENGPIDPETNQRREGFNSATVAAVEQLFERIKRGRLIRQGKDIETVMAMARTVERKMSESFHPTTFARAQAPSPAPSEDSNAAGFDQPRVSRGLYAHLLTLNPEAEGDRTRGGPTAARSALVSRGVGMSETKRDMRINPAYQRMFQPNYLLPPSTEKFLPPLVLPQQLSRLQPPHLFPVQKEPAADSKIPLQTIVTDFCGELGSSSGMSEISLLRKVRSTLSETKESDSSGYEPSLLYSVMSAVGLISDRDDARGGEVNSLGLDSLAELKTVSNFLQHNTSIGNVKKRSLDETKLDGTKLDLSGIDSVKRPKIEVEQTESLIHIRGGGDGDGDEGNEKQASGNTSESGNNNQNGATTDVPQQTAAAQPLLPYPMDANYKLYSAMAQSNSQNAMAAAAASSHLLQHQLGLGLQGDPYAAAMAGVPVGSGVGSLSASELSEFYMRNGFGFAGASASGLGLVSGPDAAAARYQAALTMNAQNPFGYVGLSPMNAPVVSFGSKGQPAAKSNSAAQRKRSSSFSQNQTDKKLKIQTTEEGNGVKIDRPASAPPSPTSADITNALLSTGVDKDSFDASVLLPFTPPAPPIQLPKNIATFALRAKFHDAMVVASRRADETEAFLVDFLLSLGRAVPKLKSHVTQMLLDKLKLADKRTHVGILAGDDKFASDTKEMIIALISMWMCVEQRDLVNGIISSENGSGPAQPELEWLSTSAIGESLSAIAPFLNPLSSATRREQMKQVVLVVGKALTTEVFVSNGQNASLPMMDELLKLLDSLRTDALQAKTRERVLLAALVSRSSNMTEAFSNAYVSSIVRAGEALTHEDVCEIVQDTDVRASTMLPFDYFQDNAGVWEEPCRPEQGYHAGLSGTEMKKEAHARSLLRKSMKRLQDQLGLKGGILDGGPYYPVTPMITSTPATPTGPSLMRSLSGSVKQKGSSDYAPPDAAFNPGHFVPPMNWNINDVSNLPYGQYTLETMQFSSVGDVLTSEKRKEYSQVMKGDSSITLAQKFRSTHEVKWEDVADMFLHGGNSRQIDINSVLSAEQGPLGADDPTGKKKIYAPFVEPFDVSSLEAMVQKREDSDDDEDEDISDETIIKAHQEVLDEMKLKLDAALEKRRQLTQQRGRKKSVG